MPRIRVQESRFGPLCEGAPSWRHTPETYNMLSTDALIVSGSEAALTAGEYDRARMLLGLALRIDTRREARRVDAALGRCSAPPPCARRRARSTRRSSQQ